MKAFVATAAVVFGVMNAAHADPFSGMRGVAVESVGNGGRAIFVLGERSNWEVRSNAGALLASGHYAVRDSRTLCFTTQTRKSPSDIEGCMKYTGDRVHSLVYALYDRRGRVMAFTVSKRFN
jgi:hypothetical protein